MTGAWARILINATVEMSEFIQDDWEDEEEDFVPGEYDEDDGDDDIEDDDEEEEDDPGVFPSVLQGEIFMDETRGLCYEDDGSFSLVCKTSIPAQTFAFESPKIDSPLTFAGWINDPNYRMEFEVLFTKEPMSDDPLQIQLLEAQKQKELYNAASTTMKSDNDCNDHDLMGKKSSAKGNLKAPPMKTDNGCNDGDLMGKKSSAKGNLKDPPMKTDNGCNDGDLMGKKSSAKGNLKAPPDYSLKEKSDDGSAIKVQANMGHKKADIKSEAQNDIIFVVSGAQIGDIRGNMPAINFRGAYKYPSIFPCKKLHLICPIQTIDVSTSDAVGGTAAVAAASKHRNSRSSDNDSDEGNSNVAYQELIELHDDTRLSTEELREKYYGSGDKRSKDEKQHATEKKRPRVKHDFGYQKNEADNDEDDDDDAYGF